MTTTPEDRLKAEKAMHDALLCACIEQVRFVKICQERVKESWSSGTVDFERLAIAVETLQILWETMYGESRKPLSFNSPDIHSPKLVDPPAWMQVNSFRSNNTGL